ncbi:MAG: zinc ribbon domain-containing protein [Acidimicrobiales bacterium]
MSEADLLRALMEADRWIDRVTSQRTHLPEMSELVALEGELRELVKALNEAQAALGPVRSAYEDAESEANRLRARANDIEKTLASSTANARDLSAMQKELEHVRELLERSEDRELEFLLALEPLDEVVRSIKERAQPGTVRRGELQATIAQLQASLDEELVSLHNERQGRASALSAELLARYDQALVRAGASGAAQVDGGRCDGCRIALSPLDHDRWKHLAPGTFMECPECGRILLP